jgi:predicted secreted protein
MPAPITIAAKLIQKDNPASSLVWLCLKNNGAFKSEKQADFLKSFCDDWVWTIGNHYWKFVADEKGVTEVLHKVDRYHSGMSTAGSVWKRKSS